jgi:hypothetical protein
MLALEFDYCAEVDGYQPAPDCLVGVDDTAPPTEASRRLLQSPKIYNFAPTPVDARRLWAPSLSAPSETFQSIHEEQVQMVTSFLIKLQRLFLLLALELLAPSIQRQSDVIINAPARRLS